MRKLLMIGAALVLGACTTVGTNTVNDFGRFQEAQNGSSGKADIHALFGQPHVVNQYTAGESVWRYYLISDTSNGTGYIPYVGFFAGGRDLRVTQAYFTFDSAGVLARSRREQRPRRYVNQWVGIANELTPDDTDWAAAVEQEMSGLGLPFDRREADRVASYLDHITP